MSSKFEISLIAGGVTICAVGFLYRKYQSVQDEGDDDFIPKGTIFPDDDEVIFPEELELLDAPFVPKPRWYHFITKYFEKEKPPIDRSMLQLHIISMCYLHKVKPDTIPQGHVAVDKNDFAEANASAS